MGGHWLGLGPALLKSHAGPEGLFTLGKGNKSSSSAKMGGGNGLCAYGTLGERCAGSPGVFEGRTVARQRSERAEMKLVSCRGDAATLEAPSTFSPPRIA